MNVYFKVHFVLALYILSPLSAFAHEGEKHEENMSDEGSSHITHSEGLLLKISRGYSSDVAPILQKKCLDCHGNIDSYPWYYSMPGIKQLMDSDITEAKEHMDMSDGFPFAGHGTPKEDLKALRKTIKEDSMPPLQYKAVHWDSTLTNEEKEIINNWIDRSLNHLTKGE